MSIVLANAAFGDDPQRWPLPPASTSHELWLRAVAAGGVGVGVAEDWPVAGVVCPQATSSRARRRVPALVRMT